MMPGDWLTRAASEFRNDGPKDWRSKAAADIQSEAERRLSTSLKHGLTYEPAQVVETKKLSEETGLPVDTVENNKPEVDALVKQRKVLAALRDTQYMRKVFESPEYAKILHKDAENLAKLERHLTDLPRDVGVTAAKAAVTAVQSIVGIDQLMAGIMRPVADALGLGEQANAEREAVASRLKQTQEYLSSLYSPAQQIAERKARSGKGLTGTVKAYLENPSAIATGVAINLPSMFMGAGVGKLLSQGKGLVGAVATGAGEGTITAAQNAEQVAEDTGKGLTPKQALSQIAAGVVTGAISAGGAKLGQKIGIADIDQLIANGGDLGKLALNVKRNFLTRAAGAGISEGMFQELPQSMQEQMWQNFAEDKPIWEGVPEAGGAGLVLGAAMGSGVTIGHAAIDRTADRTRRKADRIVQDLTKGAAVAAQGKQAAATFEQIGEVVSQMEVAKLDPGTLAEVTDKIVENTGTDSVYVPAEELRSYLDQAGLNQQQLAETLPDVAEQLPEALATGADVRIKMSDYVSKIAPTEHNAFVVQHGKLNPEGMSATEAQKWEEEVSKTIEEQANILLQEASDAGKLEASADKVEQDIADKLVATGQVNKADARKYAQLHRAFAVVLGNRLGILPEEVYQRYGLQIGGLAGVGQVGESLNQPARVRRHTGQLSYEAIPGTDTDFVPGIHKASYEQLQELQKAIEDALSDENGNDLVAQELGILTDGSVIGPGIWQGVVSVSGQLNVAMAPAPAGGMYVPVNNRYGERLTKAEYEALPEEDKEKYREIPAIDDGQRKVLDAYAAILGLVLRQDAVGYHRLFKAKSKAEANAIRIVIGRGLKPGEVKALHKEVDTELKKRGIEKGADMVAFVAEADGMRVLNTDIEGNAVFHAVVKKAAENNLDADIGIQYEAFDGNLVQNNWKENPDGQDYQRAIVDAGGDRLLQWVESVLYPRTQKVYERFSKRYGWGSARGLSFGDGGRHAGDRRLAPLPGAPQVEGAEGPDPQLVAVAEKYTRDNGINIQRQSRYVPINAARAKRLAEAYAEMPHAPNDPEVKKAYAELIKQTRAQYDALVEAGYEFYFYDDSNDPYDGNPWNAMRDLRENKRMAVYATSAGFGSNEDFNPVDNPLLEDTGLTWDYYGKPHSVLANDLFRAVHDAFGHGLEGAGFRARGEENAWQAHVRLFTGDAIKALTSETRGQNSWLNFGPHGEHNRKAKVQDTIFADQKTGLMPEWTWTEGRLDLEEQGLLQSAPTPKTKAEIIKTYNALLPTQAEGGTDYTITAEALQQLLDTAGDGYLYRVTRPEFIGEGVDQARYMHRYDNGSVRASVSYTTDLNNALAYVNQRAEMDMRDPSEYVIYRIKPADMEQEQELPVLIPPDRAKDRFVAHIHAPTDVPLDKAEIVMQGTELADKAASVQTTEAGGEYVIDATEEENDLRAASEALGVVWTDGPGAGAEAEAGSGLFDTGAETDRLEGGTELLQNVRPLLDALGQGQSAPRGRIILPEDLTKSPAVIQLLEGADLSTFLHESAHFFFEVYMHAASQPGAPEDLIRDVQVLLDYTGIPSVAEWNAMSLDEKRDAHEKLAEAFEAYLFEGKAPSKGLRKIFRTFRSWLLDVYKYAKSYLTGQQITPEVREVFDRMLATEEEIQAARRGFEPLLAREGMSELSGKEAEEYLRLAEIANADALEDLERRSLRDMQWLSNAKSRALKKIQAKAKATRAKVRAEVADEVYRQPIYLARRFLTHGELPEDIKLTSGQKRAMTAAGMQNAGHKLDTDALREMYGDGPAAIWRYLPTGRYGMHAIGGLHPDLVASIFGFRSGDELVRKLLEAEDPKTVIDAITDQRMLQEHGDLTNPDEIEKAANEAVHNEAHRRMVATELKALAALRGPVRQLTAMAKDYAEQKVASTRVVDLKPKQYLAAARKAAKQAETLLARGDRHGAAMAKQRQLLAEQLYDAASKAENEAEKAREYFKKFNKPEYLKRIDPAEQDIILELLRRYDMRKGVSKKEIDLRQHFQDLAERGEVTEFTDLPDWIAQDRGKSYKALTVEELRGLRDTIKMLATTGRNKKQLIAGAERVAFDAAKEEMLLVADKAIPKNAKNPIDEATLSMIEKANELVGKANAPLVRPEQLLQFLDGNLPDGPWHRYLFRPIAEAENARARMDAEALYKIVDKLEQIDNKRLLKTVYIPAIDESLTIEAIMTVALNMGNPSNMQKLQEGYGWTDEQLRAIVSHLTEEELHLVQEIWDAVGSLWPAIREVEREVTGLTPKAVEPAPITINGVELRGGYFPVVYDPRFSNAGVKQEVSKEGSLAGETKIYRPKIADGFTKARVTRAAGKIQLSGGLSIIPQHLAEVSHFVAHKKALRDVLKILDDNTLRQTITNKLGLAGYRQLRSWATAVANGRVVTDDIGAGIWSAWLGRLRRNVSLVAMGFKYTTLAAQMAGIFASMEIYAQRDIKGRKMGIRYLNAAATKFLRSPVETARFVFAHSDQIRNRISSFDRDARENFERLAGKHGLIDYTRLLSMKGIGYADLVVAIPTWLGAFNWAQDNGLSAADAVAHADKIVRLSQGAGGVKDLNAAQRAAGLKFVTLFFSYFAAFHGRLTSIIRDAKSENDVLRAHRMVDSAFRTFVLVVLAATVSELLAGRSPQCEEGDVECWAKWAAGKSAAYVFAGIPFARDVASALETGYGYEGTPLASLGNELVGLMKETGKIIDPEEDADWNRFVKHAMKTAGYAAGIPGISQLNITAGYAWDLYTGEDEMESPADILYFFARKPKEK